MDNTDVWVALQNSLPGISEGSIWYQCLYEGSSEYSDALLDLRISEVGCECLEDGRLEIPSDHILTLPTMLKYNCSIE